MMNFTGRYYTRDESLVVVHLNNEAYEGDCNVRWRGHSVNIAENRVGVLTFWWNENGECVKVVNNYDGEHTSRLQDGVARWDLMKGVNQQDDLSRLVGCPICEQEFRDRLGVGFDGKVPEYVNVAFLKVWDWMVGKPGYNKELFREVRGMLDGVEGLVREEKDSVFCEKTL